MTRPLPLDALLYLYAAKPWWAAVFHSASAMGVLWAAAGLIRLSLGLDRWIYPLAYGGGLMAIGAAIYLGFLCQAVTARRGQR